MNNPNPLNQKKGCVLIYSMEKQQGRNYKQRSFAIYNSEHLRQQSS